MIKLLLFAVSAGYFSSVAVVMGWQVLAQSDSNGLWREAVAGLAGAGISSYVVWHLLNKRIPAMERMLDSRDKLIREALQVFRTESAAQREQHLKAELLFWREMKDLHQIQHADAQQLKRAVDKLSRVMDVVSDSAIDEDPRKPE